MMEERQLRLTRTQSLTVSEEEELSFSMAHKDWARYKKRLEKRPQPKAWAQNLAWAFLGVAIQTAISVVIWQVTGDTQKHAWVTPLLVVITVLCSAVAGLAFYFDRAIKDGETETIATFIEDVDAIAEHFVSPKPDAR